MKLNYTELLTVFTLVVQQQNKTQEVINKLVEEGQLKNQEVISQLRKEADVLSNIWQKIVEEPNFKYKSEEEE